nr:MAG TPA: hypothetical protein [Caudoviricetes sp.]DAN80147.1 MAG TPA: hypothetical protein [Caudoviricetes sp.]DAU60855.1 MAG TPA: hypothetical protein [Caudoviricetes sp.]
MMLHRIMFISQVNPTLIEIQLFSEIVNSS